MLRIFVNRDDFSAPYMQTILMWVWRGDGGGRGRSYCEWDRLVHSRGGREYSLAELEN